MTESTDKPSLEVNRVYIKDVSFESPNTPNSFTTLSEQPKIAVQINVEHRRVQENEDFYEVILEITVTAKTGENVLYLVEVKQAGLFLLKHPQADNLEIMKEVTAPHILLPFAREEINSLVTKGGFQSVLIAPIHFERLFMEKKRKTDASKADETGRPN